MTTHEFFSLARLDFSLVVYDSVWTMCMTSVCLKLCRCTVRVGDASSVSCLSSKELSNPQCALRVGGFMAWCH